MIEINGAKIINDSWWFYAYTSFNAVLIDTSHSHADDTSQTGPGGKRRRRKSRKHRQSERKLKGEGRRRARRLNRPVGKRKRKRVRGRRERASVACINSKQDLQPYANLSCTGNPRRPPRVLFLSFFFYRLENHTGLITRYSFLRLIYRMNVIARGRK